MKRRIVCVGNLVHDEVFHVAAIPASGIKTDVLAYSDRYGGPAATAAVAICRLGGAASYWGWVGADPAGEAAIRTMRGHGVDCSGVAIVADRRTLRSIVLVDRRGERSIVSDRRAGPADPGMLREIAIDDAGIVLVDSRWPPGAEFALDRARALGIVTVLDADGGPPAATARLMGKASHVVFSSEGLKDFAGEGDAAELLRRCAAMPGQVLAVTRGAAGSLWLLNGEIVHVPAFPVTAVDTTGCGDVFHGAYALGLCEGCLPLQAARFAAAAAALKAAHGRGWDGIGDRTAVEALLRDGAPG